MQLWKHWGVFRTSCCMLDVLHAAQNARGPRLYSSQPSGSDRKAIHV